MIQGAMHYIDGMPVYESPHVITRRQFRKPRSKRKRIRKKWAKDPRNFKSTPSFMQMGNKILIHPSLMQSVRESCKTHDNAWMNF